ncbi:MAG: hypothetical protein V1854_04780 [Methanobacteriota archaeon]
MTDNNHKRNVKLSEELIDAIKKRAPDIPPGETLLAIYKEYEYLETVAKRVTGAGENDPIKISEAIEKFFEKMLNDLERLRKEHDEYKTMLQGLNLFFTKVKQ